jgi:CheY-like chemotaxis protein/HPt (histidine-containing phosphotransfer) domain-containing protein
LRKLGFKAEAVGNGKEALEALAQVPYDILLLDCQMPEMDGYETARRLRQSETASGPAASAKSVYVIAMTANAMQGDREECLAAGMDDYVSKPVRLPELEAALERALERCGVTAAPAPAAVVPAPPQTDPETLDLEAIRSLRALSTPDDPDPLRELVTLFLRETRPVLERLVVAVQRRDLPGVQAAAHSLKGSASNLGAQRLAQMNARLEQAAKAGELGEAQPLLADIAAEFQTVCRLLERELEPGRASAK